MNHKPKKRAPSKRSQVDPFIVMDILAEANDREARGENVIHMEVGQPGTPAPGAVIEKAKKTLQKERLGYTEACGIPELRERIARHYRDFYNVAVSPRRIIVTTGSSAGFILAFLFLFDAGDSVALPSPSYPCYRHILKALGINAVAIDTALEPRWMPTPASLDRLIATDKIHGLLVASPSNPTGTMLVGDGLKLLAKACDANELWLISDEIYHGLTYGEPAKTALQFSDNAIVINSFSKYFSMTGWRVGWMVVPDSLVRTTERLVQNLFISAPSLSQFAAVAALNAIDELEAYKSVYEVNRSHLLEDLPKAGFTDILPADGAFYLYVNVREFTENSVEFADRMLNETGIAVTPGVDFDNRHGNHYLRFSYAGKTEDMVEATSRLKRWMG